MKRKLLAIGALLALAPLAARSQGEALKKSVIKIFTVAKPADYYQPWQLGYQQQGTGSGLVLDGGRVLTNAHVVSDAVHLQVLKAGSTKKYTAKVKFVAHDCDLALLSVDDPEFFKGTIPVQWGGLPAQRDKVATYGFPAGGEELSITEGVISRIELQMYVHSQRSLLTIQTDAAINPGNSGGPVFKEGKCVGVSFQSFAGSRVENTGYIIPTPIIERFFKDIADGKYDGVPTAGIFTQKMESQALRDYYKLPHDAEGVVITKVVPGSPAEGVLKEGDVLTAFAGVKIAANATIPFRDGERVHYSNILSRFQMGDQAGMDLVRDGMPMKVSFTFKPFDALVSRPEYDVRPSYYVFAGFVFTPLSFNYLRIWGWNDASSRFKWLYEAGMATPEQKEVVFINQVLPHEVNLGYHKLSQAVVTKVNGQPIREMKDLPPAFAKPVDGYHVIETDNFYADADSASLRVVIKADGVDKANAEIMKTFSIPSDRSEDLK
jgi:S1-C subfamily serine protease